MSTQACKNYRNRSNNQPDLLRYTTKFVSFTHLTELGSLMFRVSTYAAAGKDLNVSDPTGDPEISTFLSLQVESSLSWSKWMLQQCEGPSWGLISHRAAGYFTNILSYCSISGVKSTCISPVTPCQPYQRLPRMSDLHWACAHGRSLQDSSNPRTVLMDVTCNHR